MKVNIIRGGVGGRGGKGWGGVGEVWGVSGGGAGEESQGHPRGSQGRVFLEGIWRPNGGPRKGPQSAKVCIFTASQRLYPFLAGGKKKFFGDGFWDQKCHPQRLLAGGKKKFKIGARIRFNSPAGGRQHGGSRYLSAPKPGDFPVFWVGWVPIKSHYVLGYLTVRVESILVSIRFDSICFESV